MAKAPTKTFIALNDAMGIFRSPEEKYLYQTEFRPEMVEQNEAALAGMTVEEYRAAQEAQARADQKATRDKIAKQAAKQKAADAAAAAAAADAAAETSETETDNSAPRPRPRLNNAVLGAGRFTPQGRAGASDQAKLWYIMGALVLIGGGAAFYSYSRRKK